MGHAARKPAKGVAAYLAVGYAIVGLAYIYLSDRLVAAIAGSGDLAHTIQTFKGFGFILVTAVLLYLLVHARETAARKAQGELSSALDRYANLVEGLPIGMALTQKGNTILANAELAAMLGRSKPKDLEGTNALTWFDPALVPELEGRMQRLYGGEEPPPQEAVIVRQDGTKVPVLLSSALCSYGDEVCCQVLLQDISEQKKLEAELVESARLELIGRIAAGLAHDFNNLLTALFGQLDALRAHLANDEPSLRTIDQIVFTAERASSVTAQLLIMAKRDPWKPARHDLNDIVRAFSNLIGRLAGSRCPVQYELSDLPAYVYADRSQVERVILNLVSNARDAMPNGGTITITTERVRRSDPNRRAGLPDENLILLAVADTGSGIPRDQLENVFDTFFSTKQDAKSLGIGLSTVKTIVSRAGGLIQVDTEVGNGTTFRIYLPEASHRDHEAHENTRGEAAERVERLVVVEDNELVRDVMTQSLRQRGYEVVGFSDVNAAKRHLNDHPAEVDLLITDVSLPDQCGSLFAKEILEKELVPRVLIVSGTGDIPRSDELRDSALPAYLRKPFSPSQLAAKVREVLDS